MTDDSKAIFAKHEVDVLEDVIDAYYETHAAGGSLHIVLDDQNWDRGSIEFCAKWAADNGDLIGEAIAKTLLKMPDDLIAVAKEQGQSDAFREWRIRRLREERKARGVTHLVMVWVGAASIAGSYGMGASFPTHTCEHSSEPEASEDFENRVSAAKENPDRPYRITVASIDSDKPIGDYAQPEAMASHIGQAP